MAFDRADWHYGGDFPKDLQPENGGTHIGFFLAWLILNDLVGELHLQESVDSLNKLKAKEITGRDFLFTECDEKFTEEDVNETGLHFTKYYYDDEKTAQYLNDLAEIFKYYPSIYHVEDTWENYFKISKKIDDAFKKWKDRNKKKNWWRIF